MNKESFGWKMAKCSEFAYLNSKDAKPKYKDLGFSRHRYFDVNGAQCHAAYDKEWFVLAFRGTEVKSWSDIKADLNVLSVGAKHSRGNSSFKENLKIKHYRFVNNSDDVTKIPFYHWGYTHHGELRYINSDEQVELGTNVWRRTLDRLKGRWDGFKNKDYFDGLSDHSITVYADNLLEYVERTNEI